MRQPHFSWNGFQFKPRGCLLEQVIDLSTEMGFAYERSCEYYKDFHAHDRLMLICPRGSSVMQVRLKSEKKAHRVTSSSYLVVPEGVEHDDEGISSIYDTMAFYPSRSLLNASAKKLKVSRTELERWTLNCSSVKRTRNLEKLTKDYFFERVVAKTPCDHEDLQYLGRKIVEEIIRAVFHVTPAQQEAQDSLPEPEAAAALRYIEANLFEPIEIAELAKIARTSVSSLMRKFKNVLKTTPYAYIKVRRLEEAYYLLQEGEHSVTEIALLVGYTNLGAFSEAFKQFYGHSPSETEKGRRRPSHRRF